MLIISVHLLICLTAIHSIVNVDASKVTTLKLFSRGVANFRTIRTFIAVSLKSCEKECNHRSRCQGVLYHRRATKCILTSTHPQNTTVANRGMVLVTNFNPKGADTVCGENICASEETCVQNGSRNVCRATECGQLPSLYSKVQGNMYGRGNKLFIQWPVPITLICGDGGIWETEGAQIVNDCTGVFGKSGVYILSPTTRVVYCDMKTDEGHWLVFQRRQDGTVDFLRNWQEYVYGFGNITGEFWLGLEPLYHILQVGDYELRVDLEDFSGERRYARYSFFTLSGKEDNYRLGVSGYTGNAAIIRISNSLDPDETQTSGSKLFTQIITKSPVVCRVLNVNNNEGDSMSRHDGTVDNDNDKADYNCARHYFGAWWYRACYYSSLNGLYFHGGQHTGQYATHIHWRTLTWFFHSLKRTEMKIRRERNLEEV